MEEDAAGIAQGVESVEGQRRVASHRVRVGDFVKVVADVRLVCSQLVVRILEAPLESGFG